MWGQTFKSQLATRVVVQCFAIFCGSNIFCLNYSTFKSFHGEIQLTSFIVSKEKGFYPIKYKGFHSEPIIKNNVQVKLVKLGFGVLNNWVW